MRIADIAVRPRIMAALAVPLAMMAILAIVALTSLNRITGTQAWVEHTYNVLTQSETIVANAVDMETGMRGFLLAGEEQFLEPYERGGSQIGELFATLQRTVDDNPPQVRKLEEAESVIAEWRREVTEPMIAMRRDVGQDVTMDDMAALVAEARGKTYFDAFRALMNEFAAEERALMELRQA